MWAEPIGFLVRSGKIMAYFHTVKKVVTSNGDTSLLADLFDSDEETMLMATSALVTGNDVDSWA